MYFIKTVFNHTQYLSVTVKNKSLNITFVNKKIRDTINTASLSIRSVRIMKRFCTGFFSLIFLSSLTDGFNHTIGDLIFHEEFDTLEESRWTHFVSGWRGGNWEFQYYRQNEKNSYVKDGLLYIKPTLTADEYGNDFLYDGQLSLWEDGCRDEWNIDNGCIMQAGGDYIINPIQSAKLVSKDKFSFHYGTVEIRAQMPKGDWLWPALWLLPEDSEYGGWPRSGEIDMCESKGNLDFKCDGNPQGRQLAGSTLHWGPDYSQNGFMKTSWWKQNFENDFSNDFHTYKIEWNPDGISAYIDGEYTGGVFPPAGGFWEYGGFHGNNIWKDGTKMAPFDKDFYFILNVAVGGNFFRDGCQNAFGEKPWYGSNVPGSMKRFWEAKENWLPTWDMDSEERAMKVDYIKVWSL